MKVEWHVTCYIYLSQAQAAILHLAAASLRTLAGRIESVKARLGEGGERKEVAALGLLVETPDPAP